MHREIAVDTLNKKVDGLVAQASDARLGALLVLAAGTKETWHALSQAQRNRVDSYIRSMPVTGMGPAMGAAWAIEEVRAAASERFSRMDGDGWAALAKVPEPPSDWVQLALTQMSKASTWDEAKSPKEFLVSHADLISEEQAKALLVEAKTNDRLLTSWGVKDTLGALTQSAHFGPERVKALVEEEGLADAFASEVWWPKAPPDAPGA